MKNYRYNFFTKIAKKIYRVFFPVQKSTYTLGDVQDICSINLVPLDDLKKFFIESIERLRNLKGEHIGDYLEFGVFNGSSLSSFYNASKESHLASTRLFGFDSFEGLPEESESEDGGVWKKGFYSCSFEKLNECLGRKNINSEEIIWVKGWYQDTLTRATVEKYVIQKLGIIFIDCDTYSSSKIVLDFIAPLITEPVIICLDDWKLNNLDIKGMGEYKAFNEFLDQNKHLSLKEIKSYNRKSKSFLIQPI